MNQAIKDKIRAQSTTSLAKAIGHFVQYELLSRHEHIMLNMQYGMDDGWRIEAKKMIDFVREVYEEKLKEENK